MCRKEIKNEENVPENKTKDICDYDEAVDLVGNVTHQYILKIEVAFRIGLFVHRNFLNYSTDLDTVFTVGFVINYKRFLGMKMVLGGAKFAGTASIGWYNHLVLLTCSVICVGVALDMFSFGIIVESAGCDLRLTFQQKGLLSSMPFSGIFFAFFWGYYADSSGRRKALILSTSGGFIFSMLVSIAADWYTVLALKFIGCSFSTAAFSLCMTFLGESTGSQQRARYIQIMNSINLSSEMISFILAYLILNLTFNVTIPWLGITFRPWRLLNISFALFLGFGTLMMIFLHESPKFLASQGKMEKALEVLKSMAKANGGKKEDYVVKSITIPENEVQNSEENPIKSMVKSVTALLRPPLLGRTAMLFYLNVVICSTNNSFTVWFPAIVNNFFKNMENGNNETMSFCQRINTNTSMTIYENDTTICNDVISNTTIYAGMLYGVFFTVLTLIISQLTKFRRLVMIGTFIVSSASCIAIDLVDTPVANLIFFALLQVTSICIGIAGSYFVDLFPTCYRGQVTCLGMMAARLGSFAGVNVIAYFIADYCRASFMGWAAYVLSGIVIAVLFLPSDTKINKLMKTGV